MKKMSEQKETSIECSCRCCKLNFEINDWTIDENRCLDYIFSFTSNYLGKKNGRLRAMWKALLGKETYYAELCTNKEEAVNFLETALKMIKESKN